MKKEIFQTLANVSPAKLGTMFTSANPDADQRIPVGSVCEFDKNVKDVYIAGQDRPMCIAKVGEEYFSVSPRHLKGLAYLDGKLTKVVPSVVTDDVLTALSKNLKLKLEKYESVLVDKYGEDTKETKDFPVFITVTA